MLTYSFENRGKDSLYESLYKQIKEDIHSGLLKPHEKLPSKRTLAKHLSISTITVENAYQQLISEGYLYSIAKSGFYVSDISISKTMKKSFVDNEQQEEETQEYYADFVSNETLATTFPFTTWNKLTRETLQENSALLMKRSPSIGLYTLRQAISNYLYEFRGMNINPHHMIIGAGTEYLYSLLIQLLGQNKTYALEDPGYQKIKKIYESFHVKTALLPLDSQGIEIDALYQSNSEILHISPSHHFPTGIITPIARRQELLDWANQKEGRYIIEDDYDSEFRLVGKPIPTLQSIDHNEKVIYINTFSKSLTSTIRISYMILPPSLMKLYQQKLNFYSSTVSNFEQLTLAKFIEKGYFEKHINRMRNYYRTQRDKLIQCIENHPNHRKVMIREENAGLHFLLDVHTDLNDSTLINKAKDAGIHLSCLSDYSSNPKFSEKSTFVINYSKIDPDRIEKAIGLLFQIL